MLDNHTKTMVETDHTIKFICIFYEAISFCIVLELLYLSVINFLSYQSFNHLFKEKPPKRQSWKNAPHKLLQIMSLFQSIIYCEVTVPLPHQVLINLSRCHNQSFHGFCLELPTIRVQESHEPRQIWQRYGNLLILIWKFTLLYRVSAYIYKIQVSVMWLNAIYPR